MRESLVFLFWATLAYLAAIGMMLLLHKSGTMDIRNPDRVWIADLVRMPEWLRKFAHWSIKPGLISALILITLVYVWVASYPIQDLFLALKHLGK